MFSFLFKILNLLSFSNVCWLSLISIYSAILNSLGCKIGFTWILFRVLDSLSSKFSIKRHIKAMIRFILTVIWILQCLQHLLSWFCQQYEKSRKRLIGFVCQCHSLKEFLVASSFHWILYYWSKNLARATKHFPQQCF